MIAVDGRTRAWRGLGSPSDQTVGAAAEPTRVEKPSNCTPKSVNFTVCKFLKVKLENNGKRTVSCGLLDFQPLPFKRSDQYRRPRLGRSILVHGRNHPARLSSSPEAVQMFTLSSDHPR